jgi:hypothetical protein
MATGIDEEVNARRKILWKDNTIEILDQLNMRSKEAPTISVKNIDTVYQVIKIAHYFNH